MIADQGCDAEALIEQLEQQGTEAVIPLCADRKHSRDYDRQSYRERHLIECLFNVSSTEVISYGCEFGRAT